MSIIIKKKKQIRKFLDFNSKPPGDLILLYLVPWGVSQKNLSQFMDIESILLETLIGYI